MSALLPPGLLDGVKTTREKQIEAFIKKHPARYTKLPPVPSDEPRQVAENFDRVRLEDLGTYRRKKHTGSADE